MARDYASKNRRRPKTAAGLPGWVCLTAGLSMGLVIAVIVYIGRPAQPMPSVTARQQQASPTSTQKPRVPVPPAQDPEYDFYTLLESEQEIAPSAAPLPRPAPAQPRRQIDLTAEDQQQDTPRPAPAAPEPREPRETPAPASSTPETGRFIILAGSFKNPEYAERHKASLALAGIESRIERVTTNDRQVFHRVRIGPRDSLASARAVIRQLEINGFDGRVVRQK